jgi:hypothetical protein
MYTTKKNSTLTTTTLKTSDTTSGWRTHRVKRFVSAPLAAQTISGTISGIIQCYESSTSLNGTLAIAVYRVDSDGDYQDTLLSITYSDNAASPYELYSSLRSRYWYDSSESNSISLTSRTFSEGDRLVVEIGFAESNTTSSRGAYFRFGDPTGSTDFTTYDTTTNTYCPWVEFSANISFVSYQDLTLSSQGASTFTAPFDGGYHNLLPAEVSNGAEAGTVVGLVSYYGGGSITRNTTYQASGTSSINLNNAGGTGGWRLNDANLCPALPGMDYVASFKARNPVDTVWIAIIWYNSSKTELSYTNASFGATSSFTKREVTATAPANTAYVGIYGDVGATSNDNQFDELMIETGTTAGTWVEGRPSTTYQDLAMASQGASSFGAAINPLRGFSPNITGGGVFAGNLSAIKALAATMQGGSSLSTNLSALKPLSATMTGSSSFSGGLIGIAKSLSCAITGTSSFTGAINPLRGLSANIQGAGSFGSVINRIASFSTSITGGSSFNSNLNRLLSFSMRADGGGSLTSNLSRVLSLSAVINGSSTFSGGLIGIAKSLTCTINGNSTFASPLTRLQGLTSNFQGASSFTGVMNKLIGYSPSINGAGVFSSNLNGLKGLSATITGSSSLTTNISRILSFTSTFTGSGTLTTGLSRLIPFTPSFQGTSTFDAILDITRDTIRDFSMAITGTSSMSVNLLRFRDFSGGISGVSTFIADFYRSVFRKHIDTTLTKARAQTTISTHPPVTYVTVTQPHTPNISINTPETDIAVNKAYTCFVIYTEN